jgi:putative methyltransferase (TIGR04325 family)
MNIWKLKKNNKKSSSNAWNSKEWLDKIDQRIKNNIVSLKSKNSIKINTFCAESPLPIMLLSQKKKVKILDFGAGSLEIPLKLAFDTNIKSQIQIDIIESRTLIDLYKQNFKKVKLPKNIKINFNEEINFKKRYDIFHFSDSFQYVDDWKIFIKKLIKNSPNFIIFNNLTAGENPTYSALQKFYKFEIPYRFYNIKKLIKELMPYTLIYKSKFLNKISNKYSKYPQNNFKKNYRLGYPCTLIFKK